MEKERRRERERERDELLSACEMDLIGISELHDPERK
jgi:hypothetical protein